MLEIGLSKENEGLISVVMSVYNMEKTVDKAIYSVLSQTFKDFEFIIIQNGSTDATLRKLRHWKSRDHRIKILDQFANIGLSNALNWGIKHASGKYIARLDADDSCHEKRFEKQLDFLEKTPGVGVLGSYYREVDKSYNLKPRRQNPVENYKIKIAMNRSCSIAHPTVMMRKSVLPKEPYNPKYKYAQDYDLWMRLLGETEFHNLPEYLVTRVFEPNYRKMNIQSKEVLEIKKKYAPPKEVLRCKLSNLIPIRLKETYRKCRDLLI